MALRRDLRLGSDLPEVDHLNSELPASTCVPSLTPGPSKHVWAWPACLVLKAVQKFKGPVNRAHSPAFRVLVLHFIFGDGISILP